MLFSPAASLALKRRRTSWQSDTPAIVCFMSRKKRVKGSGPEGLVWHYTNTAGLLGIVEGRQLWATHNRFLNDTLEGSLLERSMRKAMGDKEGPLPRDVRSTYQELYEYQGGDKISRVPNGNQFLLCGSKSGDELTLWRNYGQEAISFAVGLDPSVPLGIVGPKRHPKDRRSGGRVRQWKDVEYLPPDDEIPRKYIDSMLEARTHEDFGVLIDAVDTAVDEVSSVFKNDAFADERESRVVCWSDDTSLWRFRPGRYGLTPYIALGTAKTWGGESSGEEVLPIRAVRLSATATESDVLAVNALLEAHGFGGGLEVDDPEAMDLGYPTGYDVIEPPVEVLVANNSLRF